MLINFILGIASKTLSKLFSFATASFLGRVPSKDDSKVSLIGVLSFYWLLVVITFIFPLSARSLIPLAPDDPNAVRMMAAVLLIAIPLFNGWMTTRVENFSRKEHGYGKQIMMGFPVTVIMGFLVVSLVISIPIIKAPHFIHMNYLDTIKIMIRKGQFDQVVSQLKEILTDYPLREEEPPKVMQYQFTFLTWVQSEIFHKHMSKEMKVLKGQDGDENFQIILHATDIAITAKRKTATKIRSILAEKLNEEHLYFSWDDPSHEVEDAILEYKHRLINNEEVSPEEIRHLAERIKETGLSQEEWNSIRRQIYHLQIAWYERNTSDLPRHMTVVPDYLMASKENSRL
ncbi:hypothetical protein CEF21_08530 [Bacillus sp. FJAT-42376]|uniref:hypothetical protein n=1 Tax=Bacillus sp. FJAT-42376 TaxID=2014076 RepID=UPI000F4FD518|nr:hypothetical protein [Bacillus sp. FJAT-42376]AZB42332.1 hypothetical protein CEF21_08530 [Bacillus sp. FJAT-42376]